MGDYMGITAYGGRVYGIWSRAITPEEQAAESSQLQDSSQLTNPPNPNLEEMNTEKTNSNTASSKQTSSGKNSADEGTPPPKLKGLFVEVGLGDFSTSKDLH
jgi:hypothetical protein